MRTHTNKQCLRPASIFRFIVMIIGGAVMAGVFAFLFGYFVMLLWNWLMPAIFGLGLITFWQAFGIIILSKLLFGAFNHGNKKSDKCDDNGKEHYKNWIHNGVAPWKKHRNEKKEKFSNWQHYESYWEDEGKNAFDEYVKKKNSEDEDFS